jgi:opacity protein-like surface antigen
MFINGRSVGVSAVLAFLILAGAVVAPRAASADDDDTHAAVQGVSLGGRAVYDRPKDASEGTLGGGVQVRFHLLSILALEASGDMRQNKFGGETVDTFPVQASVLLYLMPHFVISPYILGGVGWYYTHVQGASSSPTNRYGPHAGAGLEVALSKHWTIDGSYRYLWNQSLVIPTTTSPAGKNFSDNGFMITAALNFRF